MTTRWRVLLLGLPPLLGAGGLLAFLLTPGPPAVTRGTFQRLRVGMTREEVAAIIGEPTPGTSLGWTNSAGRAVRAPCSFGRRYTAAVAFDQAGRVEDLLLVDELQVSIGLTFWERLRLQCGLP